MSEKPIIFSAESVSAILRGDKTQTRRVIKPQPVGVRQSVFVPSGIEDLHGYEIKLRYRVSDRLWVRTSWKVINWELEDCAITIEYANGFEYRGMMPEGAEPSDYSYDPMFYIWNRFAEPEIQNTDAWKWYEDEEQYRIIDRTKINRRSPIYLPKWLSPLWLEVTEIRAQNLHVISDDDVLAEGYQAREDFFDAWDRMNARRGFPADSNPFVFAYTFKVVDHEHTA